MTPSTKPVTRLTDVLVRDRGLRPLVATLHGSLLILRPKGCRREEVLDIGAAYSLAVKQRVSREQWEKKQKRKGKL
jgi:hypothetical protein